MKLDETDLRIIDLLKDNGRVQNNEIAEHLSISEGTVRNRIKKLTENNYLSIRGMVNPDLIDHKQIMLICIKVSDPKKMEAAAKKLSKIPYVNYVYMVTGSYDLIVEIFIEPKNLLNFLSNDLALLADAGFSTDSFIVMKSYKKWV